MIAHLDNRAAHLWDRIPVPQEVRKAHLTQREAWFHEEWKSRGYPDPAQCNYRAVFEDPSEPDAPCKVLVPAPWWLAMAMNGDLLPPIEAWLADQETPDGAPKLHPYVEPIGPMTEEQAIEYLVMKDIPRRVWDDRTANAPRFRIVPAEDVPSDRTFRNAWRLAVEPQDQEQAA